MKTEESKYSLETWQQMERDYRSGKIPELSNSIIIKGFLPYQVYLISTRLSNTPNYLSESEYKRILKEQIRVFDIRLRLGLNYTFNSFKKKIKGLPMEEIERAIQDKIQIYEDASRNVDLQVRDNVNEGEKRPYGIDYNTYTYTITQLIDKNECPAYFLTYENNEVIESNEYLDLWFNKGFINRLKNIDVPELLDSFISNPWDRINGVAKACINKFISDGNVKPNNEDAAKQYLTIFEIVASKKGCERVWNSIKKTDTDIREHEDFTFTNSIPTNRATHTWLSRYKNIRGQRF